METLLTPAPAKTFMHCLPFALLLFLSPVMGSTAEVVGNGGRLAEGRGKATNASTATSEPPGRPEGFVWISPGTFLMGSGPKDADRYPAEEPSTRVTLSAGFWMGQHEVTQAQYETVVGTNPSHRKGPSLPVDMVSWDDAVGYCKKLTSRERARGRLPVGYSYRLPTEAEWEYACRAGTFTPFAFGKTLGASQANFGNPPGGRSSARRQPVGGTVPVGSYTPNAWGLYDMHGNVWEWCQDWFVDALPGKHVTDPKGPKEGTARVNRGGSWGDEARQCRSATRNNRYPETKRHFIGFRVVLAATRQ